MKRYKNDIILVSAVLLSAIVLWVYISVGKTEGACAVIAVDGEELYRLSLKEDQTLTVGKDGKFNVIVVESGAVYIKEASCPDHLCIDQGAKKYEGETIVCLPNKITVTIAGGKLPDIDATVR